MNNFYIFHLLCITFFEKVMQTKRNQFYLKLLRCNLPYLKVISSSLYYLLTHKVIFLNF